MPVRGSATPAATTCASTFAVDAGTLAGAADAAPGCVEGVGRVGLSGACGVGCGGCDGGAFCGCPVLAASSAAFLSLSRICAPAICSVPPVDLLRKDAAPLPEGWRKEPSRMRPVKLPEAI